MILLTAFNWKRTGFRTLVSLTIIFTGLTVPKFGKILNLVGGSTVALTTFIMPPIFYICLVNQDASLNPNWEKRTIKPSTKVLLIAISVVGIVGGGVATWSALDDLFDPHALTAPCYISQAPDVPKNCSSMFF